MPLSPRVTGWEAAAAGLRDWAVGAALPLWAGAGFDGEHHRFEERLTLDGKAIVDVPLRLMVQGRQIFSFAVAAKRGWNSAAIDLVETAYATMVREYHRADGRDGWIFSIRRDGTPADAKRDLYAHAFVLLAIASYVEVTGKRGALALADETLAYLDRSMCAAEAGGYVEALPLSDRVRRQNPHMHLLEGLLALWHVSTEQRYLAHAEAVFELFRRNFFKPSHGVLGEYYDQQLHPAAGEAGETVEPGHHYEWVWLLRKFEAASGRVVQPYVEALYRHADRFGYAPNGLIVDELFSDGRVRTASHRVWPITEAIKANVVEAARGRPGAEDKVAVLVAMLRDRFLVTDPPGGWIDRLDDKGNPATSFAPASTFYHIMCLLDVLHQPC